MTREEMIEALRSAKHSDVARHWQHQIRKLDIAATWTDGPDSEAGRAYRGEGTHSVWPKLEALARQVSAACPEPDNDALAGRMAAAFREASDSGSANVEDDEGSVRWVVTIPQEEMPGLDDDEPTPLMMKNAAKYGGDPAVGKGEFRETAERDAVMMLRAMKQPRGASYRVRYFALEQAARATAGAWLEPWVRAARDLLARACRRSGVDWDRMSRHWPPDRILDLAMWLREHGAQGVRGESALCEARRLLKAAEKHARWKDEENAKLRAQLKREQHENANAQIELSAQAKRDRAEAGRLRAALAALEK